MRYTWDTGKASKNLALHGVSFADAIRIFDGPTLEKIDDRFDYGENRVYAIGLVDGLEITVVYTDLEDGARRLISARRAEPHERRAYWEKITEEGWPDHELGQGTKTQPRTHPTKHCRRSRRSRD